MRAPAVKAISANLFNGPPPLAYAVVILVINAMPFDLSTDAEKNRSDKITVVLVWNMLTCWWLPLVGLSCKTIEAWFETLVVMRSLAAPTLPASSSTPSVVAPALAIGVTLPILPPTISGPPSRSSET